MDGPSPPAPPKASLRPATARPITSCRSRRRGQNLDAAASPSSLSALCALALLALGRAAATAAEAQVEASALGGASGVDLTRRPRARGAPVVEAVCRLIKEAAVLPRDDRRLLRRAAYAASRDGADDATYRAGYHGGIWQVDEAAFTALQRNASSEQQQHQQQQPAALVDMARRIEEAFGIVWSEVRWLDLETPLFSGLAASLRLASVSETIPVAVTSQALYWTLHLVDGPADGAAEGAAERFVNEVQTLESTRRCRLGSLIYLLWDVSGSIPAEEFNASRRLLERIVDRALDLGPGKSQVGLMSIGDGPLVHVDFTADAALARAGFAGVHHVSLGTKTGRAIDTAVKKFMAAPHGYAGHNMGSRACIVVTDGFSADDVEGPARRAEEAGITMISLAVGLDRHPQNLLAIANGRSANVLSADGAEDVTDVLAATLRHDACLTPVRLARAQTVQRSLDRGDVDYFATEVSLEGVTVELQALGSGVVAGFAAYSVENPNEALHEFALPADEKTFVLLPTPLPNQSRASNTSILYMAFQGLNAGGAYSLSVAEGDRRSRRPQGPHFLRPATSSAARRRPTTAVTTALPLLGPLTAAALTAGLAVTRRPC